ncbi:hypothetical protein Lser_V15G41926 [Lactuca serriola]
MAKFNTFSLFFLSLVIMASMAPPSLSRTLVSSYSSSMDPHHSNAAHVQYLSGYTTHSRARLFKDDAHEVPSGPNPISNNSWWGKIKKYW